MLTLKSLVGQKFSSLRVVAWSITIPLLFMVLLGVSACRSTADIATLASPCVAREGGFREHDMEPCVRETPVLNSLYMVR